MRIAVLVLVLCGLGGCASEFEITRAAPRQEPVALASGDSVYVAVPPDGMFEGKPYAGSGASAAKAAAALFARHAGRAEAGTSVQSAEEGLATARSRGFTHCASLQLLHWEDRATEWSGKRDKATVGINLTQVKTGAAVDSATVSATGTWWTLGGDHPEGLLERMMQRYEKDAFGAGK
jgi:hypothetical protein